MRSIILTVFLAILMNNPILGQSIKLNAIYVDLTCEVQNKDTIYYPYTIGYEISVFNNLEFNLIFGAYHTYTKGKYKNGVFRANINGQLIDMTSRREQLFLILPGDTLDFMAELHNKIFLSMAFRKEDDIEAFKESLKNVKITYQPVIKDYPINIVGTYFIKEVYEVFIDDPYVFICNDWKLKLE
jgi:hypothetical protein